MGKERGKENVSMKNHSSNSRMPKRCRKEGRREGGEKEGRREGGREVIEGERSDPYLNCQKSLPQEHFLSGNCGVFPAMLFGGDLGRNWEQGLGIPTF